MDIDSLRPVFVILAGASIAVAGLLMGGSALFGDEIGEKAKKRVLMTVQGFVLFAVATALMSAFG